MFDYVRDLKWMNVEGFAATEGKDWTYIIFGRGGPTGKTYLCNRLRKNGHNAFELSEGIIALVDYLDSSNHYLVYEQNKCVVIILNKRLPEHIYPGSKKEG